MRRQMEADAGRHAAMLKRKEMAARAQMPEALSDLCVYSRGVFKCIVEQLDVPDAPSSAISALKSAIEHIEQSGAIRTFELVSWLQVQSSRLTDSPRRIGDKVDLLYDIVLLQAYVNSLFDFARNETQTVFTSKPTQLDMVTAYRGISDFSLEHKHRDLKEKLMEIIERRHPKSN